jgi:hypothetical protein
VQKQLKVDFKAYATKCEKLLSSFDVALDGFPELVELKKRNSVLYQLRKYTKK